MQLIILTALFLIPLIGLASFPINNEIAEITNQIPNENLENKKLWYNTWWAILLNILLLVPSRSFLLLNLIGFTGLILRIKQNKKLWKLLLIVGLVVGTVVSIVLFYYLSKL